MIPNRKINLILGGGLAGLSAAYHLNNKKYVLIEKERELGGTARTIKSKGFTFDFTGHLLHLHTPYTKNLIRRFLKNNIYECVRKTFIYSYKTYTKYPFQAHTYGLPQKVIDECMLGYLNVYLNRKEIKKEFSKLPFSDWCEAAFGKGISNYFMTPYNEKLYQVENKNMVSDWCGQFVPKPKLEDVIKGALLDSDKEFGYNATFIYPKKGGIQVLAEKFSEKIPNVRTGVAINNINIKKKYASFSTGEKVFYENMINTIPLIELLKLVTPIPRSIRTAASKLKFSGILCINIGVSRPNISDKSWIYFPERKFPFYRVGFPMNFTPHAVPRNSSSMYVEVPFNFIKNKSRVEIKKSVLKSLIDCGILKSTDKIPVFDFIPIKYAYVIYDKYREPALKKIFNFLQENNIQSIGRYGGWKYSFMEAAILDGKNAAEAINKSLG